MKPLKSLYKCLAVILVIAGTIISCEKEEVAREIVRDIDGNIYHTITIGKQVWMLENLNTTKYRNGDPIPNIMDNAEWSALTTGAYCTYDNIPGDSSAYVDEERNPGPAYGLLYNWHAVSDIRNVAPAGFRVPTAEDWQELTAYIIDYAPQLNNNAGDRMKEAGFTHWKCPSVEVPSCPYCRDPRNETGFTALPTGMRDRFGTFLGFGLTTGLWSSSTYPGSDSMVQYRYLNCFPDLAFNANEKECGFSVRCIRDYP